MSKSFARTALATAAAALLALAAMPATAAHVPGTSGNHTEFTVDPSAVGEAQTSFQARTVNFNYEADVSQDANGLFSENGLATLSTFNNPFNNTLSAGLTGLNLDYEMYATFAATGTTAPSADGGLNGTFTSFTISFFVDRDSNTTTTGTTLGGPMGDDVLVATGSLLFGGFHVDPGFAEGDFAVRVAATPVGGFFSNIPFLDITGVNTEITGVGPGAFTGGSIIGSGNVQAIPEPETYALMLAGLGALGFVARRRRRT